LQKSQSTIGNISHQRLTSMDKARPQRTSFLFVAEQRNPIREHRVPNLTVDSMTCVAPAVRQAVDGIDRDIPLPNIATMDELLENSVIEQRFRTWLLGGFAGLALLLASVGIYAVISYSVGLRTEEIGIRMALGAWPRDIFRLVLSQATSLAAIGLIVGTLGALALMRTMSSLLFSISSSDPISFAIAALILVSVALVASSNPA
jgi:hypothetical protein